MTTRTLCLAGTAGLVALGACAPGHRASPAIEDETTQLAENGSDTSTTESDSETMTTSLLSAASARVSIATVGIGGSVGGDLVPLGGVPIGSSSFYQPAGCLTGTRDDAARTATFHFDRCSGPLGLARISGDVNVTWSAIPNGLHLDLTGSGLTFNRASVDAWTASADITASGADRTMQWGVHFEGSTARGRPFARDATKTVTWSVGAACLRVPSGTSTGSVGGKTFHTTVKSYARCRGSCPEAGSEITITSDSSTSETGARTIDVTFNGGTDATFTAPSGARTPITVACGP